MSPPISVDASRSQFTNQNFDIGGALPPLTFSNTFSFASECAHEAMQDLWVNYSKNSPSWFLAMGEKEREALLALHGQRVALTALKYRNEFTKGLIYIGSYADTEIPSQFQKLEKRPDLLNYGFKDESIECLDSDPPNPNRDIPCFVEAKELVTTLPWDCDPDKALSLFRQVKSERTSLLVAKEAGNGEFDPAQHDETLWHKIKVEIPQQLEAQGLHGWLITFKNNDNPLVAKILELPPHRHYSRRFFYYIPAEGEPVKVVPAIEEQGLDHLPGRKLIFGMDGARINALSRLPIKGKRIALEYSPGGSLPAVDVVPGGVIDMLKGAGVVCHSSGDLLQYFLARWTPEMLADNRQVAKIMRGIVDKTNFYMRDQIRARGFVSEIAVQDFMFNEMTRNGLVTDHKPICAVNANSAVPHYSPTAENHNLIRPGDFVLIDLWSKLNKPGATMHDITWVMFVADEDHPEPPPAIVKVFDAVKYARNASIEFVRSSFANKTPIHGFEVDLVSRAALERRLGTLKVILHRTGHSITQEGHGCGAHADAMETWDSRLLMPWTCISIEPGAYFKGSFGVRLETNIFLLENGIEILAPLQEEIIIVNV